MINDKSFSFLLLALDERCHGGFCGIGWEKGSWSIMTFEHS
jgi:hypothetical protein